MDIQHVWFEDAACSNSVCIINYLRGLFYRHFVTTWVSTSICSQIAFRQQDSSVGELQDGLSAETSDNSPRDLHHPFPVFGFANYMRQNTDDFKCKELQFIVSYATTTTIIFFNKGERCQSLLCDEKFGRLDVGSGLPRNGSESLYCEKIATEIG